VDPAFVNVKLMTPALRLTDATPVSPHVWDNRDLKIHGVPFMPEHVLRLKPYMMSPWSHV
jgi:hypothetical protein